jgi:hypothetical protein
MNSPASKRWSVLIYKLNTSYLTPFFESVQASGSITSADRALIFSYTWITNAIWLRRRECICVCSLQLKRNLIRSSSTASGASGFGRAHVDTTLWGTSSFCIKFRISLFCIWVYWKPVWGLIARFKELSRFSSVVSVIVASRRPRPTRESANQSMNCWHYNKATLVERLPKHFFGKSLDLSTVIIKNVLYTLTVTIASWGTSRSSNLSSTWFL